MALDIYYSNIVQCVSKSASLRLHWAKFYVRICIRTYIHMYGMYLYGQDDFMSSIALSVMEKFNTPGMYDGLSRLDLQVV